jgi:hypothetical protein
MVGRMDEMEDGEWRMDEMEDGEWRMDGGA